MLKCQDCEFFSLGKDGGPVLTCNPFSTVKEPECLAKWQLVQLNVISKSHQATLDMYQRLAPLQEKMFKQMERELDDADDADSWKLGHQDDDDNDFT